MSLCPFYLPREFWQVIVTACYVPPSANTSKAAQTIYQCIEKLETASPDAPQIILGDMNGCKLDTVLSTLKQYVSCNMTGEEQLDLCYCNIKGAYKSIQKPPVGTSDHFAVQQLPPYIQKLRQEKVKERTVQVWSAETIQNLKWCSACTDRQVFIQDHTVEESLTAVTDYILLSESRSIPTKTVKSYPNDKPWLTAQLKGAIQAKCRAFATGHRMEVRA